MAVFIKQVNIPQKSDLINIDMTGSGTAQTYRIIKKISDDVVEMLAMEDATTITFGSSNIYEGSALDTYCNTTWYGTLSEIAKSAIVDKTFRQEEWSDTENPLYVMVRSNTTVAKHVGPKNTTYGNEITRHCYTIGMQDLIDYLEATPQMTELNTTLNYTNIWQMFWNTPIKPSGKDVWLNDSGTSNTIIKVLIKNGSTSNSSIITTLAVRPAFQIDLSKIDYTFADGRQEVGLKSVSILQKSNNALSRVGMSWKIPEPRVTDLTGTTWQFNDNITSSALARLQKNITGTMYFTREGHSDQSSQFVYDIDYNSGGYTDFIVFFRDISHAMPYVQYYPSNGWQLREGSDVRTNITTPTIAITGGDDVTNTILIDWFYTNATRIS